MPRCCSRRIQSEVACRAAFRPFTAPAIWMAPPNRSSFSVRVVLPASGCEMMANVRRRLISFDTSCDSLIASCASGGARPPAAQGQLEHTRVFAPADRLIVAATRADLLEPQRMIEPHRRRVRRPHLEIGLAHASGCRPIEQVPEQRPPHAAAARGCSYAQIQNMGLACARAHHAVADELVVGDRGPAHITDPQAVAEDALAPGELI